MDTKRTFVRPELVEYGSLEKLTAQIHPNKSIPRGLVGRLTDDCSGDGPKTASPDKPDAFWQCGSGS